MSELLPGTEVVARGLRWIDFLKQDRVLDHLERSSYDVVVIDEAHHCMDLGAAGEREDSQRRRLAQVLARHCDTLLLLTATPHDGHDRSFASLCELLDPALVDGRGALRGTRYQQHVVRRLKRHIKDPRTGADLFKERLVSPIPVLPDARQHARFIALQHALLDLIAPELRRAFSSRRYSDVLSYIALLKRSVSTVAACQSTLEVVVERVQTLLTAGAESQEGRRQRLRTLREYQRKLERFGAATSEEEEERHRLEAEDLAQRLADLQREVRTGSRRLKRTADVVAALDDLGLLAAEAAPQAPKLQQLVAEIAMIRQAEPGANVLVYTEYITSQQAAAAALHATGLDSVLTMSGDDPEAVRQEITERFRSQDGLVLVSTDTAAEGLNLHARCHYLIHLELPFNPNRLEQRNGRIDRYGQTHNPIVRYLYLRGTFEERILLRLIAKYERQRARLTFVPNTLGLTTASEAASAQLLSSGSPSGPATSPETPCCCRRSANFSTPGLLPKRLREAPCQTGRSSPIRWRAWLPLLPTPASLLPDAARPMVFCASSVSGWRASRPGSPSAHRRLCHLAS
jgi:superfamily II DNA or RNA helicase